MENQEFQGSQQQNQPPFTSPPYKIPVPNSTAVLVLGILSIVVCCFFGLIMGIIALVLASKGRALYDANPQLYTETSFNNMKAGRICAIIGLVLNAMVTIYYLIVFLIVGTAMTFLPWDMFNT
ncbi:MAG: CCC motif membrane protein [Bacteroidetes bacterium]|nr:CCC motif membrane protein [Bacteroidota bacterium]